MRKKRDCSSKKYITWRDAVYRRDGMRCQMPGCDGSDRRLHAHHIQRYTDRPSLRFAESNGITLCKTCHDSIYKREDEYEERFLAIVRERSAGSLRILRMLYAPPEEDREDDRS